MIYVEHINNTVWQFPHFSCTNLLQTRYYCCHNIIYNLHIEYMHQTIFVLGNFPKCCCIDRAWSWQLILENIISTCYNIYCARLMDELGLELAGVNNAYHAVCMLFGCTTIEINKIGLGINVKIILICFIFIVRKDTKYFFIESKFLHGKYHFQIHVVRRFRVVSEILSCHAHYHLFSILFPLSFLLHFSSCVLCKMFLWPNNHGHVKD